MFNKRLKTSMNILVIKLGAAGDVVRTTAILPGLKEKYPKAQIDWLTDKPMIELLDGNPCLRGIFFMGDKSGFAKNHYDLVINFDEDFGVCLLASHLKTKRLVGTYADDGEIKYTPEAAAKFDMSRLSRHSPEEADRLKKVANKKTYQELCYNMLGLKYRGQRPYFHLEAKDKKFAAEFAKNNGLKRGQQIIGINTGAGGKWHHKKLGLTETVTLIKHIASKHPKSKLILFNGLEHYDRHQVILEKTAGVRNLVDGGYENTFRQLGAKINLCQTLVTSDSLALHIGTALKKKIVAFFGPTSPWEVDLYGKGAKILPIKGCLNCWEPKCKTPPEFNLDEIVRAI